MKILLLGSGGREHALARKISESPLCEKLFIAPGNAGTSQFGENLAFGVNDFEAIEKSALENQVTMIVVGPEDPLVNGIYDFFQKPHLQHISVIGPSKEAAQMEGSKAFSKKFMARQNIPTAAYKEFDLENLEEGIAYIETQQTPIVLKADGLAAGKGVLILDSKEEAKAELREMIANAKFGKASSKVVIEGFLDGIEFSVFVITDGKNYKILPEAKDYKRIGEGDKGLNTGGMGAVSPVPFCDDAMIKKVEERIIQPTVNGLQKEGLVYHGFIFFGLIKVKGEPYVIEYNCRMGDPETEVVIPRVTSDLVQHLAAIDKGNLADEKILVDNRTACTVVVTAGGYPGEYKKGDVITGLEKSLHPDTFVYHAGTKSEQENIVTNGGRVLAVTSFGETITNAVTKSNQTIDTINFEGKYFRSDVGYEFK